MWWNMLEKNQDQKSVYVCFCVRKKREGKKDTWVWFLFDKYWNECVIKMRCNFRYYEKKSSLVYLVLKP